MEAELSKRKKKGSTITLTWTAYSKGYVWSNIKNSKVADTQLHVGVCYEERVYCNIHLSGLPKQQWINDFNYPGVKHIVEVPF